VIFEMFAGVAQLVERIRSLTACSPQGSVGQSYFSF